MRRKGKNRDGSDPIAEITEDDQEESRHGFDRKANERGLNDPQVFARNLNVLIQLKGWNLKYTADEIGADYLWMRRIVTRGLVRITGENLPYLKKLTRLFEINRIEYLWMPDLIVVRKKGRPDLTDPLLPGITAPYARKLILLLASGEHDYLKEMIDKLHGTLNLNEQ